MGSVPGLAPYVAVTLSATVITAVLGAYARRHRREPGARWFVATMAVDVVYTASYAVALTTTAPEPRLALAALRWTLTALLPVPWLLFVLAYTGRQELIGRRLLAALAVVPAATAVVALDPSPLLWRSAELVTAQGVTTVVVEVGPWALVVVAAVYLLTVTGAALIVEQVFDDDALYTDQALSLLVGAVTPLVTSVMTAVGYVPVRGVDLTPMSVAVVGLAFGNALYRNRLFDRLPAMRRIGERAAVEAIEDGVVVLDRDDRVTNVNPAAERVLGPASTLLGAEARSIPRLARVLDAPGGRESDGPDPDGSDADPAADPGSDSVSDDRRSDSDPGSGADSDPGGGSDADPTSRTVEFVVDRGVRTFDVRISPIEDRHGRTVGRTLVFRDVSERERRERRVAVMNRLLRHNLRNDMTVVEGYADLLADVVPEADREKVETVGERSRELIELTEKVRQFERAADDTDGPADVDRTLAAVVEDARREHGASVDYRSPPAGTTVSDGELLGLAVQNLIENSIEHGSTGETPDHDGTADPSVSVTVAVSVDDAGERPDAVARVAPGAVPGPDRADPGVDAGPDDRADSDPDPDADSGAVAGPDADGPTVDGPTVDGSTVDGAGAVGGGADRVDGDDGPRWITVAVADDGPGIPVHERRPVAAGDETALEHGSGVGLWVVRWAVDALDGRLSFADREGGGSVVVVQVPAVDPAGAGGPTSTTDGLSGARDRSVADGGRPPDSDPGPASDPGGVSDPDVASDSDGGSDRRVGDSGTDPGDR